MQLIRQLLQRWQRLPRRHRRVWLGVLVELIVAAGIAIIVQAGWFASAQYSATNYLYETAGDPGNDIVIVAIDEKSQQTLGDWPWTFAPYTQLFDRLQNADVIGFDVLLPDAGPKDNPDTPALVDATRKAGNVVLPLAGLELASPAQPGSLYTVGRPILPFPALRSAAEAAGAVEVVIDSDGVLRRAPLMMNSSEGLWEAFALRILRRRLGLGDDPAVLVNNRIVIGTDSESKFAVQTDANGAMLINFVGHPGTFPAYSFIDVVEDRVPANVFEDKIVLVGLMNSLAEMDLHQTPVSAGRRMAGVEIQANIVHTLLNHSALTPQTRAGTILAVILPALLSGVVLMLVEAVPGAIFTLLLAAAYFGFTISQFNRGVLLNVFFPYLTIFVSYAMVTATRFAGERAERRQVTDIFGRFVSAEVRNEIMTLAMQNPDLIRPGGGQKEISVLFADIRGFTTISENLSPPEVVEILNLYLDSMEAEVFKEEGTIDKYTGDGMMVLFGAPLTQADHALRAVRAALAMQKAAAGVSQSRGEVQWPVAYGIGIATGMAVVGHIGSKRRLDYTAIGDTVNLSARIEGKAPPGAVLISQNTYEAVKDRVEVEALEPMMMKGKAKAVQVYKVVGLKL